MDLLGYALLYGRCALLSFFPFAEKQSGKPVAPLQPEIIYSTPFPQAIFQVGLGMGGSMEVGGWKEHKIENQEVLFLVQVLPQNSLVTSTSLILVSSL